MYGQSQKKLYITVWFFLIYKLIIDSGKGGKDYIKKLRNLYILILSANL